jgi:hypothetical protein
MPWIRKGKKDFYQHLPEPDTSLLDTPFTRLLHDPVLLEARTRQNRALDRHTDRIIMDWLEFHQICPRHACRRAGICKSPTVECHEENFATLKEHFYPKLLKALREQRAKPRKLYDPRK